MSLPERLSSLPQDTQQQASDRGGIQTLRSGPFQPSSGAGLRHWFPNRARRATRAAIISGLKEGHSSPHWVSRRAGLFPLRERKLKSGAGSLLQGNCPIKITQYIKKKNLYLVLNEHLVLLHPPKIPFAFHYRSGCVLFSGPQRARISPAG